MFSKPIKKYYKTTKYLVSFVELRWEFLITSLGKDILQLISINLIISTMFIMKTYLQLQTQETIQHRIDYHKLKSYKILNHFQYHDRSSNKVIRILCKLNLNQFIKSFIMVKYQNMKPKSYCSNCRMIIQLKIVHFNQLLRINLTVVINLMN